MALLGFTLPPDSGEKLTLGKSARRELIIFNINLTFTVHYVACRNRVKKDLLNHHKPDWLHVLEKHNVPVSGASRLKKVY